MEGGTRCEDYGVEEYFGGGEIGGRDCLVPQIIDMIANNREASSFLFLFLRSFDHINFAVHNVLR